MTQKRFYLPNYVNKPDRPCYIEDIGSMLITSGIVLQGMGSTLILLHPNADAEIFENTFLYPGQYKSGSFAVAQPTLEEWAEIIRLSDDPMVFIGEEGELRKTLHRKQRFAISGETQQKVWVRDNFTCVYCGAKMGKVLMTIDHFVPLEQGGKNDDTNYVTACRRCNKDKGMLSPQEFCTKKGFDYESLKNRLDNAGVA